MYLTDPRLSSNQQVLELVKELRGSSWGLVGSAAFLGLLILIFSMGEGFVAKNPDWGLNRPNPFQPPAAEHRFPPDYDLFFPIRTCYADRISDYGFCKPCCLLCNCLRRLSREGSQFQISSQRSIIVDLRSFPRLSRVILPSAKNRVENGQVLEP